MTAFSALEQAYLSERRLGRLATIGADGMPHVVPLGWGYNPVLGTIDVTGRFLRNHRLPAFFRQVVGGFLATAATAALYLLGVLPEGTQPELVVAAGLATRFELQLAYAIGVVQTAQRLGPAGHRAQRGGQPVGQGDRGVDGMRIDQPAVAAQRDRHAVPDRRHRPLLDQWQRGDVLRVARSWRACRRTRRWHAIGVDQPVEGPAQERGRGDAGHHTRPPQ